MQFYAMNVMLSRCDLYILWLPQFLLQIVKVSCAFHKVDLINQLSNSSSGKVYIDYMYFLCFETWSFLTECALDLI
jgi:hypothetical protein